MADSIFNSIWMFPLFLISLIVAVSLIYKGGELIKDLYYKYKEEKLSRQPIDQCCPNYMYWQKGDILIYAVNRYNDKEARLLTFHNTRVIIQDIETGRTIAVPPAIIKCNNEAEARKHERQADEYHRTIFPVISADPQKSIQFLPPAQQQEVLNEDYS